MTVDLTRLIKSLEWRELRDGNHRKGECFTTRSPVSFSPISVNKKHDGWWLNVDCRTYPDLAAAQAAANADYVTRVLAAIDTALVAELVEAENWQIKARAQHWLRRTITVPEDVEVEALCNKYGYGAVMDAASRLWARFPHGSGAFYIGGCIGFKSDDEARAALAKLKEGA